FTEGIRPTLAELERFHHTPDSLQIAAAAANAAANLNASVTAEVASNHCFTPGDVVEVCEGDLKNLRVELRKFFSQGDHVKNPSILLAIILDLNQHCVEQGCLISPFLFNFVVDEILKIALMNVCGGVNLLSGEGLLDLKCMKMMSSYCEITYSGRYANETGLVIRFDPTIAVVLSDNSMNEMKVAPKDLRLWQDRATTVESSGHVQLMDLVQVDPQTVGVVVHVERDQVSVLTCFGKVVNLKSNTALRRLNTHRRPPPQALDRNGGNDTQANNEAGVPVKTITPIGGGGARNNTEGGRGRGNRNERQLVGRTALIVKVCVYFCDDIYVYIYILPVVKGFILR
ncbi:unnamed protein product, partial [Trichobilharzia regenti]